MYNRAHAIITTDHPGLTFHNGHATYRGLCPACQQETVVDRNVTKCAACGRELIARIIRLYHKEPVLQIEF